MKGVAVQATLKVILMLRFWRCHIWTLSAGKGFVERECKGHRQSNQGVTGMR
jgi:hypothetical protein